MTADMFSLLIVVLFVVLFLVIWSSLKAARIFSGGTNIVLSICVAALCLMSLFNFLSPRSGDGPAAVKNAVTGMPSNVKPADLASKQVGNRKHYQFILLPYLALLITVPGLLLLLALAKIWAMCRVFVSSSSSIRANRKSNVKQRHIIQVKNKMVSSKIKRKKLIDNETKGVSFTIRKG